MLCQRCQQRPATVRVTRVNNGMRETDYLCEKCAAETGALNPVSYTHLDVYKRQVQMWWNAIDGIMRPTIQGAPKKYMSTLDPWELQKSTDPENILRAMDKYGVDVACILPESMMDTTGYSSRWCTNGDAWKAVQTHPDRFILNPNLSPIKKRGVQNAIWEMEYCCLLYTSRCV